VSLDGLEVEQDVEGLADMHHDFTVLPGGIIAGPSWTEPGLEGVGNQPSDLLERAPDGTLHTVAHMDQAFYPSYRSGVFRTSSISYVHSDETYVVGDEFSGTFVKLTRQGEIVWQLGGTCPTTSTPRCVSPDTWRGRIAGHHVLPNGNLLFVNTYNPLALDTSL